MTATPVLLALLYPALFSSVTMPDNYIVFPDENQVPHIVYLPIPPMTLEESTYVEDNVHSVTFWLYTRNGPVDGKQLIKGETENVQSSDFDPTRPTRFITHGWHGDRNTASCTLIRDAYLKAGNFNVIVIDWGKLAGNLLYGKVAKSVPIVARYVASFLNFLREATNMNPSTTKLVGHSLGAHLASLAARFAAIHISEVVGLDPAKPYFDSASPGDRIDSTDAAHVQVIHTNGGRLGLLEPYGTSDFYPNNGRKQPGCSKLDVIGVCAHSRAYQLFAESILNATGFRSQAIERHSLSKYSETVAYMGGPILDQDAQGSYYLKTAAESPFALG